MVFGFKQNLARTNLLNFIYPVGSVYLAINDVNPNTIFGGTWEKIEDRYLLGSSSSRAAGTAGGSNLVEHTPSGTIGDTELTTEQLPAHTHTYDRSDTTSGGTALTEAQLPAHTHSYDKAATTSGSTVLTVAQLPKHTHTYAKPNTTSGSTALTVAQLPAHTHKIYEYSPTGTTGAIEKGLVWGGGYVAGAMLGETIATGSGSGHTHSIGTTSTNSGESGSGSGHTHTITLSSVNTGSKGSGNTHTHSIGSSSATSGSTGSGNGHTHTFTGTQSTIAIQPKYISVNVWKRTA